MSCVEPLFAQEPANDGTGEHFLFFSGFEAWRNGDFLHGGLLWSPHGLAQEGFTLKLLLSGGSYRYHAGATPITGNQALADVMPGYRFKYERLEVTLFAGIDLQHHWFVPDDPGNRLRGTHAGLRAGFDLWYEPTDMIMTAASLWASTNDTNTWARAAAGVRFLDRVWVGPEAVRFEDHTYSQWRVGVHATSFRTGPYEWSAGFGYAWDSDRNAGPYGRIGLLVRR